MSLLPLSKFKGKVQKGNLLALAEAPNSVNMTIITRKYRKI